MIDTSLGTVLVVDDNDVNRQLTVDVLRHHGYRVIEAAGGEEAVSLTEQHRPALIVLDIQMPNVSGLDVLRILRHHDDRYIATTPIIAATALAMAGDRERCMDAGANDYLARPFSLSALVDAVRRLLKQQTPAHD